MKKDDRLRRWVIQIHKVFSTFLSQTLAFWNRYLIRLPTNRGLFIMGDYVSFARVEMSFSVLRECLNPPALHSSRTCCMLLQCPGCFLPYSVTNKEPKRERKALPTHNLWSLLSVALSLGPGNNWKRWEGGVSQCYQESGSAHRTWLKDDSWSLGPSLIPLDGMDFHLFQEERSSQAKEVSKQQNCELLK